MRCLIPILVVVVALLSSHVTQSLDFLDFGSSKKGGKSKGLRGDSSSETESITNDAKPAAVAAATKDQSSKDQVAFLDVTVANEKVNVASQPKSETKAEAVEEEGKKRKHKKKSSEESETAKATSAAQEAPPSTKASANKVEFIDLSASTGSSAKEVASTSSEKKSEEGNKKVEFVDLNASSDSKAAAAAPASTNSEVSTSPKQTDEKQESSEKTAAKNDSGQKKAEKVDFIDIAGSADDTKAKKTSTETVTTSSSKQEKKVEFIDLNDSKKTAKEESTVTAKESAAVEEQTTTKAEETVAKNKKPAAQSTSSEATAKKVEFVDLNATPEKGSVESKASTSSQNKPKAEKAEGTVELLETKKEETSKTSTAKTTASEPLEMLESSSSSAEKKGTEKKSTLGSLMDLISGSSSSSGKKAKKESAAAEVQAKERILITGVSSALGAEVARQLLESIGDASVQVYGLLGPDTKADSLSALTSKEKFSVVAGNLNDGSKVSDLVQQIKPTVIYHLAGQEDAYSVSSSPPQQMMEQNVQGTLNLLEALRSAGLTTVKIFGAGSSSEYGYSMDAVSNCDPMAETTVLAPRTVYGLSKYTEELLLQQYGKNFGFTVFIGRFFSYLGPSMTSAGDDRYEAQAVMKKIVMIEQGVLSSDEIIDVAPQIQVQRDLLDLRDAASAAIAIMDKGAAGDVYNIGSGEGVTMRSLLGKVVEASKVDAKSLKVSIKSTGDVGTAASDAEKCAVADIARLKKATGFSPKFALAKTIEDTLAALRVEVSKAGSVKQKSTA